MMKTTNDEWRMNMSCMKAKLLFLVGLMFLIGVGLSDQMLLAQETDPPEDQEREELIRKLEGESDDDVMVRMIRRMGEASQRLDEQFDVGPGTQQIQKQILQDMEQAIEEARQSLKRSQSQSDQQQQDQRQEGETSDQSTQQEDQSQASGSEAAESAGAGEAAETKIGLEGELRERRRQWGNLPAREREQLIQSFKRGYPGAFPRADRPILRIARSDRAGVGLNAPNIETTSMPCRVIGVGFDPCICFCARVALEEFRYFPCQRRAGPGTRFVSD